MAQQTEERTLFYKETIPPHCFIFIHSIWNTTAFAGNIHLPMILYYIILYYNNSSQPNMMMMMRAIQMISERKKEKDRKRKEDTEDSPQ